MEIIYGQHPPNYKTILKTFNIKNRTDIVFTYGDKLYVPGGEDVYIDPHLLTHEETHVAQQADIGAEQWWKQYLTDPTFRIIQEIEAYRNQYRSMYTLSLRERINYLDHIAADLSGEMYGNLMTIEDAERVITDGIILKSVGAKKRKHDTARKLKKRQRQNRKKGRH